MSHQLYFTLMERIGVFEEWIESEPMRASLKTKDYVAIKLKLLELQIMIRLHTQGKIQDEAQAED